MNKLNDKINNYDTDGFKYLKSIENNLKDI